jgi:hypothetical protein
MRTGLGFDLWLKDMEGVSQEDDLTKHNLYAIKQRFQEEYTKVLRDKHLTTKEIAEKCAMSEDEVKLMGDEAVRVLVQRPAVVKKLIAKKAK